MSTTDPYAGFGTTLTQTPQRQRVPGRSDQVQNREGAYVFQIDPITQLRRFLTIGTLGGTYYVGQDKLTAENGTMIIELTKNPETHRQLVDTIVEISLAGRAQKQNPTLFALAIACQFGDTDSKVYARRQITKVVRTGTHLFTFCNYLKVFGGFSRRGIRTALRRWYEEKTADELAYQLIKYRQREGWTHKDVLRLGHPVVKLSVEDLEDAEKQKEVARKRTAIDWAINGSVEDAADLPASIWAHERVNDANANVPAILKNASLPWEALPDSAMNDTKVWDVMLDNGMPINALVRQLSRLTRIGVIAPIGGRTDDITKMLLNPDAVRKSRIHPISVLFALATYRKGHGFKGGETWEPVAKVVDALDELFYLSFPNVEPAGKRTMDCLDLSDSMTWSHHTPPNSPLNCREIAAAMAMVSVRTEPDQVTMGFTSSWNTGSREGLSILPISARQRLDDVVETIRSQSAGGTDCSLPMQYATKAELEVDTFVIWTDNETHSGHLMHPFQALQKYRKASGINAKLVVCGMTPDKFSIADPKDPGMLDVSGFDSAVPSLIADFSAGRV